jgi:hypothetical protein
VLAPLSRALTHLGRGAEAKPFLAVVEASGYRRWEVAGLLQ